MADLTPEERAAIDEIVSKPKLKPIPAAEHMVAMAAQPEPIEPSVYLNHLLIEIDADLTVISDPVRHQGILRDFAKQVWAAGFEAAEDAIGKCCGCGLDQAVPNPFDTKEPDNG